MKFLADHHHGGAARAQVLLLDHRLGHQVYFPSARLVDELGLDKSLILPCMSSWAKGIGGIPSGLLNDDGTYPYLVHSLDELKKIEWDAFLITRVETQEMFKGLKREYFPGRDIKMIALTGNDACTFDYSWIKNLMTSDEPTYNIAPNDINKIHYSQELGMQYGESFIPIGVKELKTINCFINCWHTFTGAWQWNYDISGNRGKCPHCNHVPSDLGSLKPINPYGIWEGAKSLLPDYTFNDYGIECKMGCIPEVQLPLEYASGALTVHMKTYDGYGFSMLQSIACGRPVIVPYKFHKYRTANKYLIPNVTCFEADWTADSVYEIIKYVTGNLKRANEYAAACYVAAKGLFNWGHDAFRVKEFLERLI